MLQALRHPLRCHLHFPAVCALDHPCSPGVFRVLVWRKVFHARLEVAVRCVRRVRSAVVLSVMNFVSNRRWYRSRPRISILGELFFS